MLYVLLGLLITEIRYWHFLTDISIQENFMNLNPLDALFPQVFLTLSVRRLRNSSFYVYFPVVPLIGYVEGL